MRIDAGIIIQRPAIFMRFTERDFKIQTMRSKIMNEYVFDDLKHLPKLNEVTMNISSINKDNPLLSEINIDNYPSHRMIDHESGEVLAYCAASKHFSKVDPSCRDVKSLHMAPEQRVYLVFKNRHSGDWEFPTLSMFYGDTFTKAKNQLFR